MASSRVIRAAGGCWRCGGAGGVAGLCCAGVKPAAASRAKTDANALLKWILLARTGEKGHLLRFGWGTSQGKGNQLEGGRRTRRDGVRYCQRSRDNRRGNFQPVGYSNDFDGRRLRGDRGADDGADRADMRV